MKEPPSATAIEKFGGHVVTESALTVVAALAGGPIAALLPVLTMSLASERQQVRVEKYLLDVSATLSEHAKALRDITDAQYKLINEAILASLQTTQAEKLDVLRTAVRNALGMSDVQPQEAILLSRIIRDISSEEVVFVVRNFAYSGVHLIAPSNEPHPEGNILCVDPNSRDALVVSGLLSLGILTPGEPTWDAPNILSFSGIVARLIVLLRGSA